MSWGEIPEELLTTIFQNLTKNVYRPADLYRCLNVCQSWRIVAKEVLQSSTVVALFLTRTQKPNTLLFNTSLLNSHKSTTLALNINSSSSSDDTLRVYGRLPQKLSNILKLTTYASHGGWLLLGDKIITELLVFLLNPVSGVIIRLPPLPKYLNLDSEIYFVMSETSPTDRNCIICISNYIDFVASCKPAKKRSKSWIMCTKPHSSRINIRSMIFCCDNFYTLDYDGALFQHSGALLHLITDEKYCRYKRWRWPVNEDKVAAAALTPPPPPDDDDDSHVPYEGGFAVYLVKSKSGQLLMVHRARSKLFTSGFSVYKFTPPGAAENNINGCWKKTNSLGENEALIMGCTHDYISISVDKNSTMQTYKPNCIYFFDQIPGTGGIFWGYGMYNLERGHIKYWDDFQSSSDDNSAAGGYCSCMYYAEPRLFTPSVPSSSVNITYLRRVMLGVKKICTKFLYSSSSSCNQ